MGLHKVRLFLNDSEIEKVKGMVKGDETISDVVNRIIKQHKIKK